MTVWIFALAIPLAAVGGVLDLLVEGPIGKIQRLENTAPLEIPVPAAAAKPSKCKVEL